MDYKKTKLAKWGNSLAIRLPAELVASLNLQEGDEVRMRPDLPGSFIIWRRMTPEEAHEVFVSLSHPAPADYTFNREEANARPGISGY